MVTAKRMAGASGAMVFAGLLSLGGVSLARAEDGAAPVQTDCSFPCLFHAQQPAPQPAAAADPNAASAATSSAASDDPASEKPAPKKPVRALTIEADAAEIGRLKALASVLPGQPIKIVEAPKDAGRKPASTDLTVKTSLEPSNVSDKGHDAKLFTEQLHIIAGPGIAKVEDLRNRVVSFGIEGSPNQDAARKAFQALGVSVKETPLDLDNALDGAATGDVDAVVVLAPAPFDRLKGVSGLHLLAWPEGGTLPEGSVAATIAGDHYPGLAKPGETFRAVGVDAILSVSEKGEKQPATKRFMTALAQHSATLSKRGFDLLKADLESRSARRVASAAERRATDQ